MYHNIHLFGIKEEIKNSLLNISTIVNIFNVNKPHLIHINFILPFHNTAKNS